MLFSLICALSSVLLDLSIMDMTSFIQIEAVVATNLELVWKETISSLGQIKNCYGYMNAYENVLQAFGLRDLISLGGLLIAFGWMSAAVKVFAEFSQDPDLPSRLVNDAGSASRMTAWAVLTLIALRLGFILLRVATNIAIFSSYLLNDSSNPFSTMPHVPCLPVTG